MTNCVNGLCHQHTLLRRFLNKNFTCEERQVYTVYLKVNTVIAIGHDIFVYTVLTKLRSTCWGLTSVDHQAHYFHYGIKALAYSSEALQKTIIKLTFFKNQV